MPVWPVVTEFHGIAAAVPTRYSIVSASRSRSVKPSKRVVAATGVAGRRGSVSNRASEAGVVAVAAVLILSVTLLAALAAGIRVAIFSSFPVIFAHVVPLMLCCIPGATPVILSVAAAYTAFGATNLLGTTTFRGSEAKEDAVALVLT